MNTFLITAVFSYFGNDGQPDYGAANEAMNHIANWMGASGTDGEWTSLAWLGWAGIGMTRGSEYEALARSRGLRPVTKEEGQAIFSDLVNGKPRAWANLLISEGEIAFYKVKLTTPASAAPPYGLPASPTPKAPAVRKDFNEVSWELSQRNHPYILDHVVGGPRLFVGREDVSQILSCSLSHARGWVAAACAADGHPVGVDIETVRSHSTDFRAGCFTEREKSWAEQSAAASDMSCDVLYTLLWTLKESAYKAVSAHTVFPWRAEVSMKSVMSSPLSEFIQDGGLLELSRYDLEVCINGWHRAQGATCRIALDCLLSMINILERGM